MIWYLLTSNLIKVGKLKPHIPQNDLYTDWKVSYSCVKWRLSILCPSEQCLSSRQSTQLCEYTCLPFCPQLYLPTTKLMTIFTWHCQKAPMHLQSSVDSRKQHTVSIKPRNQTWTNPQWSYSDDTVGGWNLLDIPMYIACYDYSNCNRQKTTYINNEGNQMDVACALCG